MRKIFISGSKSARQMILLLFALVFSLSAIARNKKDTIVYIEKSDTKHIVKVFKNSRYYTDLFLDWGSNGLDKRNLFTGYRHESADDFPKLRNSASRSFSIYTMFGRRSNRFLSIMSGIGIDWTNYRFSHEVTLRDIDGVATQVPISSVLNTFSFTKSSKLSVSYLQIPLLLKLDFHRFFIAAGVTGGLNMSSRTKIVFIDTRGKKQTYKGYDLDLATFRYGYTLRAGFRCFAVYVNYHVSPLFNKGEGPQVYPFSTGISLKL